MAVSAAQWTSTSIRSCCPLRLRETAGMLAAFGKASDFSSNRCLKVSRVAVSGIPVMAVVVVAGVTSEGCRVGVPVVGTSAA
jgi:hypothetical protein